MTPHEKYIKDALSGWKFTLGMLLRLPSIVFWGVRVQSLDENHCKVTIPYTWRTQNPFRSIYFAALAGAGELSTGALCRLHLAGRDPISMLVVDFKARYFKKADSRITFHCKQGAELRRLLDALKNSGDTATIVMTATGTNPSGMETSIIEVTWSFRKK